MHKTEVYILGQKYTIKADEPPEYVQKLASYVDEILRKVYEQNTSITPLRAAILTCIYIADEFYKTKKELEDTKKEFINLENKTNEILSLLD
jgi:hypothetical protein